jgi:hypothetical protein
MKTFRHLIALAICLGMTGIASADPVDFKMNVLDPLSGGEPEYSNTFSFNFVACSTFANAPSGLAPTDGCFEGMNATGVQIPFSNNVAQTWTSLVLTFSNVAALQNQVGDCVSLDAPDSIFSVVTSCGLNPGNTTWVLSFTNGVIAPGDSFFIAEDGVPPGSFPTVSAVAGTTPEPSSILLLSSGVIMFGMFLYAERARILRIPTRS